MPLFFALKCSLNRILRFGSNSASIVRECGIVKSTEGDIAVCLNMFKDGTLCFAKWKRNNDDFHYGNITQHLYTKHPEYDGRPEGTPADRHSVYHLKVSEAHKVEALRRKAELLEARGGYTECLFCFQKVFSRTMQRHLLVCNEKSAFYAEDGRAKQLIEYFSLENPFKQSQNAMNKWKEWEELSGNGGKHIVYIYTIPPNDSGDQMNSTTCGRNSITLRERIVYVGHTARPKERFLSHKMKFASIFPGQKLNYCIIATNLHPTQALALELSISMLILESNVHNKRFNWLNLCQSDHFSCDLKESRDLQLLAACEFLYKCPTKPDALIQVESTNEIRNIKNDLIKEPVITDNKKDCAKPSAIDENECPYCLQTTTARLAIHYDRCDEYKQFYDENGLAKILMNSNDLAKYEKAKELWSKWINLSGRGGRWRVYFFTRLVENPTPQDIVYVGVTSQERFRISEHKRRITHRSSFREKFHGKALPYYNKYGPLRSPIPVIFAGKTLQYYRMEMGIDNTFGDNSKLHPTQAYALEQAIIMLIRKSQNLWNKTFEPLKLCQSDHFSVDQRETIELQLLAAKNLLQLTLNKGSLKCIEIPRLEMSDSDKNELNETLKKMSIAR